jgi:hypothetical protein
MGRTMLRRILWIVLLAVPVVAWFGMRYDRYAIDGDAVAYMDIADLIQAHRWAGVVNAYWHPLYPLLLLVGRVVLHAGRMTELGAYYKVNFALLLLQAVAVLAFCTAVCRLRDRWAGANGERVRARYVLPVDGVRLLGIALLVIASQRELTLGKVRPDGLLQALLLFGFASMLMVCAEGAGLGTQQESEENARGPRLRVQLGFAALMGLSFGLGYLTKSFALLVALLSFLALAVFQWVWMRRPVVQAVLPSGVAFVVFLLLAGPWVAALSHQKHRLDFGDSGSLNYAWYVAGTEKFHLEPWQRERFGSSDVHLVHPERQLMEHPGVYSYKALAYGTIPPWFDATFFNERIVTHIRPGQLLRRDVRNVALVFRYLLNHPEAWLLLGLLLFVGARLRGSWRHAFWVLPVALGVAIWAIYGLVNVEERYVTAGYLTLLLPVFAALQVSAPGDAVEPEWLPGAATVTVTFLALLSLGESVRFAAENRREYSIAHLVPAWRDPGMYGTAEGLHAMGVKPGDEIACVGTIACVYDPYWMRLAGVRTTTEIFLDDDRLAEDLAAMPNRDAAYRTVQAEGARVLVGHFDPSHFTGPVASGWERLGSTDFFALPLNLSSPETRIHP